MARRYKSNYFSVVLFQSYSVYGCVQSQKLEILAEEPWLCLFLMISVPLSSKCLPYLKRTTGGKKQEVFWKTGVA